MQFEKDAVPVFHDLLRRRIPTERGPGRVGEQREVLIGPRFSCGRRRGDHAAKDNRSEQCDRATHAAAL
jgi:hypothetical protein